MWIFEFLRRFDRIRTVFDCSFSRNVFSMKKKRFPNLKLPLALWDFSKKTVWQQRFFLMFQLVAKRFSSPMGNPSGVFRHWEFKKTFQKHHQHNSCHDAEVWAAGARRFESSTNHNIFCTSSKIFLALCDFVSTIFSLEKAASEF